MKGRRLVTLPMTKEHKEQRAKLIAARLKKISEMEAEVIRTKGSKEYPHGRPEDYQDVLDYMKATQHDIPFLVMDGDMILGGEYGGKDGV